MKSKTLKYPTPTTDTKEIVAPVDSEDAKSRDEEDLSILFEKSKFAKKDIDVGKILELAGKDIAASAIAKVVGCSTSNVVQHLRRQKDILPYIKNYDKHIVVIRKAFGLKCGMEMLTRDLKRESFKDLGWNWGVNEDKLIELNPDRKQHGDITINLQTIITQQQASQREIEDMERKVLSGD